MTNLPLLSVIVPCYNVEKYINNSISSIVGQTYQNLEIILINDGSTDSTGYICNKWRDKECRIKVIHKQNQGASSARKDGLKLASGKFVTFVDADDWININMYSNMMTALLNTNSDIAECDMCFVYDDEHKETLNNNYNSELKILNRIEGVVAIVQDLKRITLNTKIFKKILFENIIFPLEIGYGDDMFVYKLYHKASQSVYLNQDYYFYLQRSDDSICNNKNISAELKKLSDWSEVIYECYSFIAQHSEYHAAKTKLGDYVKCVGMRLLRCMVVFPKHFKYQNFRSTAQQVRSIPFRKGELLPKSIRIEIYILKISPLIYKFYRTFYNKIIQFTNKLKITNRDTYRLINDYGFYWYYL
ncbi:MAG: glycosyltransferase [Marinilabiliaceae bacterium]|nr:glycosyltransferase [Marinilabiliaceae bacterium]